MTIKAMARCSATTLHGFVPCSLAIPTLMTVNAHNPQITLTKIAVGSLKRKTGIVNVRAKPSFEKNVARVSSPQELMKEILEDLKEAMEEFAAVEKEIRK